MAIIEFEGPYVVQEERIDERGWLKGEEAKKAYQKLREAGFAGIAGIKMPPNPKVLGEGSQGTAFSIGSSGVLKITEDKTEAGAASILKGKNLRGVYEVYGVFSSEDLLVNPVYMIIQPRLKATKRAYKVGGELMDHRNSFGRAYNTWLYDNNEKPGGDNLGTSDWWKSKEQLKQVEKFLKTYKAPARLKEGILNICWGLYNLKKLGIRYFDLWGANVMETPSGEIVLIDIGYSKGSSGTIQNIDNKLSKSEADMDYSLENRETVEKLLKKTKIPYTLQFALELGKIIDWDKKYSEEDIKDAIIDTILENPELNPANVEKARENRKDNNRIFTKLVKEFSAKDAGSLLTRVTTMLDWEEPQTNAKIKFTIENAAKHLKIGKKGNVRAENDERLANIADALDIENTPQLKTALTKLVDWNKEVDRLMMVKAIKKVGSVLKKVNMDKKRNDIRAENSQNLKKIAREMGIPYSMKLKAAIADKTLDWEEKISRPMMAKAVTKAAKQLKLIESILEGISKEEAIKIGQELNVDFDEVDADELHKGINAEFEHSSTLSNIIDPDEPELKVIAAQIALDHLDELPDYYTQLDRMEEEYKDKWGRPSAAKRGYGHAWTKLRKKIIDRDGGKCVKCGEKANEVDHRTPKSRKGKDIGSNLRLMCGTCHRKKTKRYDRKK